MSALRGWIPMVLFAGVMALVVAMTMTSPAHAKTGGPIRCPDIYAPVTCDNGKTYPNQCYADRAHAKNCVPTGGI